MLTLDRLVALLHYDAETGDFVWRAGPGRPAGRQRKRGYLEIKIDRKSYQAHRLAWLWMTGSWPDEQVDHIDCAPSNNRWANLRAASRSQNSRNRGKQLNNSVGLKGVTRKGLRYQAQLQVGGRNLYLGTFKTPEEAHAAYCSAAREHHGEFARVS